MSIASGDRFSSSMARRSNGTAERVISWKNWRLRTSSGFQVWSQPLKARLEKLKSGVAGRDQAGTALLGSEVLGVLPAETGGKEAVELVAESLGSAAQPADWRKAEPSSQVVGCPSKIDLGVLRTNGLGG